MSVTQSASVGVKLSVYETFIMDQTGTLPELRKNPPKSMKGMMTTGATAKATSTLGERQERK